MYEKGDIMQDELKKENGEGEIVNLEKNADAETEEKKIAEGVSEADEFLANAKEETLEKSEETAEESEAAEVDGTNKAESGAENQAEESKEELKETSQETSDETEKVAEETKDAPQEKVVKPAEPVKKNGVVQKIYSWLNCGMSHILPFVIGGGILIALAFTIDTVSGYSSVGENGFGSVTPLAAILKYLGELTMGMVIPVLAGYIAKAIAGKSGLAIGFIGGVIASLGNASLAGYSFVEGVFVDGKALDGFSDVLSKWAFEQPYGGYTGSGVIGGIVAGFLAGFIALGLQKMCEDMPDSAEAIKTTIIYPIVGSLLVGLTMCFIFNPVIGLINGGLLSMLTNLSDSGMVAFLGLILGAMIAVDLDGPFNKAAYAFGVRMLTVASVYGAGGVDTNDSTVQAFYIAMAAIMVGSMVPPVGVALASLIFSKKFTKEERCSAIPNILMGISGITEGAVPIAVADPLRVIPCTMVGAGVAGFLVAQFKCTLTVPFGGLFVVNLAGKPIVFIVAWLVGSAVTCVMLGLFKKKIN